MRCSAVRSHLTGKSIARARGDSFLVSDRSICKHRTADFVPGSLFFEFIEQMLSSDLGSTVGAEEEGSEGRPRHDARPAYRHLPLTSAQLLWH